MIRVFGSLALVALLAACGSSTGPDSLADLEHARTRWEGRGFTDYAFETRRDCFCAPALTRPVRITVLDDSISSVLDITTDSMIPFPAAANWYTVEDLFTVIDSAARRAATSSFDVEYDPDLGYPNTLEVNPRPDLADAGVRYTITLLVPAP